MMKIMNRNHGRKTMILAFSMLFFAFIPSLLPPTFAVPSSRILKAITTENSYHHDFQKGDRFVSVETADYSWAGANNHHDPKSPPAAL